MPLSNFETIKFERRDRILRVILNRPDKANAVNAQMHAELPLAFAEAEADLNSDILVLTGAGRVFSAGGDFLWFQEMIDTPAEWERTRRDAKRIIFGLLECEKPVIGHVNGSAIGLGATLALFCDVIFAAESARIGDPHVSVGMVAGDGGAVIWPQLIGYARAKEFLMTGNLMSAAEAARIGLINHVYPDDELAEQVDAFCDRLSGGARRSIQYTKVAVNIGLRQLASSVLDASLAYEAATNFSDDHQEAVTAFVEGRVPKFTGN